MKNSEKVQINIYKFLNIALDMVSEVELSEDSDREFYIAKLKMFLNNGLELIEDQNLMSLLTSRTVILDNVIKFFIGQGYKYFSLTDQNKSKTNWKMCIAFHDNFMDIYSFNHVINVEEEKIETACRKVVQKYKDDIELDKKRNAERKKELSKQEELKKEYWKKQRFDRKSLRNSDSCEGCRCLMTMNSWEFTDNGKKLHIYHCTMYNLRILNKVMPQPCPGEYYAEPIRPEICKTENG